MSIKNEIIRKRFLVNWILILIPILGISQNENNHWQLGVSDVNFTTNPAIVNVVANGGKYGEACLSDVNGNLLLYTNGIDVWNKNHTPVTNGTNTGYAIDNVLIVPNPANANQYYVFRAETFNTLNSSSNSCYNYSIVEFNATYPLGILLNINPTPDMFENNYKIRLKEASGAEIFNEFSFDPLTIAKNANADGYWLILQSKNKILSYKIDLLGLNTVPVESTFTNEQVYDYGYNAATTGFNIYGKTIANFKISPDNTKIGCIKYCEASRPPGIDFKGDFYTLNFNSTTGQFSNFISVHSVGIYSIINDFEFSNDSGKVYFTKFGQSAGTLPKGEIVVKDLNSLASPERVLFDFANSSLFPANFNYLQRDKHGNLLVSSTFSTANRNLFLHKVENQNSYSTSSVSVNSISLNSNPISKLPKLIPSITNSCPTNLSITTNVTGGVDAKQASTSITASNSISNPASAIYHSGSTVYLTNGFNVTGGAKFRAYIEGCTGNYVGKMSNYIDEESQDISSSDLKKSIKIYPNPSNSMIIISSEDIKMKQISISSLNDNRVVIMQKIDNLESIEVDVAQFEKGIYIVSIELTTGEILTQKLIKN